MIRLERATATVPAAIASEDPRRILDDLSAEFRMGESHLILGPNGAGKTTLVRLLAGLKRPASGRVVHFEVPVDPERDPTTLWPHVAALFEEPDPQFLTDTVESEVAFGLESLALPPGEIQARVAEALEANGLSGFERRLPDSLSAGEKVRTLVAAMMAGRPKVLLVDQTFAHLDPGARRELEGRLNREARSGRLCLIRTHQDTGPLLPSERLHVIDEGRLVDGVTLSPRSILESTRIPFPLPMRISALLAERMLWNGPLAVDGDELAAKFPASACRGADAAPLLPPMRNLEGREIVLEVKDAAYAPRGRASLIAGVTLGLRKGEVVAIVGVSGSGKSTLLKLVAGLIAPTEGYVDHTTVPRGERPSVALALEYPERQLFGRSVEEDVTATLWVEGVPSEPRRARGREAMEAVGLDPDRFGSRVPLTLSEGEKRRVALAGMVVEPRRVLLLDEPTAGLDPEGRRAIAAIIRDLSARGHTILFASHDLDFAAGVSDRVLVLGREDGGPGRILGEGRPSEIWLDGALLDRAHLPPPDFVGLEATLRKRGALAATHARDAESLLSALARSLDAGAGVAHRHEPNHTERSFP